MTDTPRAPIPAGWYPYPHDSRQRRWWDGSAWTPRLAPSPESTADGDAAGEEPTAQAEAAASAVAAATPYPTRRQLRDQEAAAAARALLLELASPSAVFGKGTPEELAKAARPEVPPLVAPSTPVNVAASRATSHVESRHSIELAQRIAASQADPDFSIASLVTPALRPQRQTPEHDDTPEAAPPASVPAAAPERAEDDAAGAQPDDNPEPFAGLTPRLAEPMEPETAAPESSTVWLVVLVPLLVLAVALVTAALVPGLRSALVLPVAGLAAIAAGLLFAALDHRRLRDAGQPAPASPWLALLTPAGYLAARGLRARGSALLRFLPLVVFVVLAAAALTLVPFTAIAQ
jgi:hypothetical protein